MESLPTDIISTQMMVEAAAERLKADLDNLVALSIQSAAPLQQAQCHMAFMNTALSIGRVLRSLHGNSADSAAFKAEQTSAKAYQAKVQKAVALEELKGQKKHMEINIDAAHRFITHAIPELSSEQRSNLKEVASQRQSRLNQPSLLAANRKPINSTIEAKRGQTAVERLHDRQASPKNGPGTRRKRDAAVAFLDELDAELGKS